MKAICVWHDHFSSNDPEDHEWIVSLEDLDDQMCSEKETTLASFPEYDDAVTRALEVGRRRNLPVYRNTDGETAELLQEASLGHAD